MTTNETAGRLPDTVRPERYDLHVTVRPDEGRFSGRVRIAVQLAEPASELTLHAQELEIGDAHVEFDGRRSAATVRLDPAATTLTLSSELPKGSAVIEVAFAGQLNRQMKGLYEARATFEGVEERYAFTQCEPTDARRFFPCFDEPAFKATFCLEATAPAPAHLTILSNMPAVSEARDGATKTVRFADTPVMSTYLLALAVGRLGSVARRIAETHVAVWAQPRDLHLADFALDVTEATLPLLNDYFGLPYPYPKLDLVAVPDFAMGAMENWGAIFFRDSRLLVDTKRASTATQRVVANVIVHEIVHQWFGNLVTMAWWDDLWLNEAFATWLACKIVDQWRPEWRSWEEFQLEKQIPLELDALDSSRPIVSEVRSSSEIESMFDPLTYEKGAAVLRMIERFIGEEAFRDGIRVYMRRHQFGNTVAADLWRTLEAASGHPVGALAKDWLTQAGYPIVSARDVSGDGRTLTLGQRPFSAHGPSADASRQWSIPVVVRYEDAAGIRSYRVLLDAPSATVALPGTGPVRWVYPNGDESGFYRVETDSRLRESLYAVAPTALDPAERIGWLNHVWALAQAREVSIDVFMAILMAFKGDGTRVVVEAVAAYLDTLADRMVADGERPFLGRLAEALVRPVWDRLGWGTREGEGDEPRLTRAAALWILGSITRDPALLADTERRLAQYLGDRDALDPTLAATVVRLGARLGGEQRFRTYQHQFARAGTPEDRDRYLMALAEFRDAGLAARLMAMTLTDAVRGQDVWKPFRPLLASPAVQGEAWEFVKTHWQTLRTKAGPVGATRIIQSARALWHETWYVDVRSFFAYPANQVESAAKALDQTLEFLRLGLEFRAAQSEPLARWLRVGAF
ncbi:MAG: M1 family metallopeptidase [Nitrospirae bacterium]|nr:M1 family metallopeptidase [Nitrospirota bacterium]